MEQLTETVFIRLDTFFVYIQSWVTNHLFSILLIILGAWLVRRLANDIIDRLLGRIVRPEIYPTKNDREKRIRTLGSLGRAIVRLGVYAVATLLIVGELYPSAKAVLLTSAGVIGAVIGFGAQSLIKDLTTGIFIISENQYRIGDEVALSAGMGLGKIEGTVEDLTIRTTVLRDLSGNVHHIPNGNIGITANKTLGFSQMNEEIIVHFDTDLDKLTEVIKKVGEEMKTLPTVRNRVIEQPHVDGVIGFTDKGIIVRILARTSAAAQWKTRSEFYKLLQKALAKSKIKLVGQSDNEK